MRASTPTPAQRAGVVPVLCTSDDLVRVIHGLEHTASVTAGAILGSPVAAEPSSGSRRRHRRGRRAAPFAVDAFEFMEALPMAVLWLDCSGTVRHCNARALQLLGTPLLGVLWRVVVDRQPHPAALASGVQSNAFRDGQLVVYLPPLAEAVDTSTAQHAVERERMLARLGRLSAGLAHQLRTPITAAQLYLDLAVARGESRYLVAAQSALDALTRHCESVLTLARGELRMDEGVAVVTLATLLERQTAGLRGTVRYTPATRPASLRCNAHLLVGALTNLIDNAVRAAPAAAARVQFSVDDAALNVVIDDDGPGFPIEWLPYRGELLRSSRSDGSGIGLAMANLMIEAHGGNLTIANRSGGGARVCVRLPCTPADLVSAATS